jgi:hypothetical protein
MIFREVHRKRLSLIIADKEIETAKALNGTSHVKIKLLRFLKSRIIKIFFINIHDTELPTRQSKGTFLRIYNFTD